MYISENLLSPVRYTWIVTKITRFFPFVLFLPVFADLHLAHLFPTEKDIFTNPGVCLGLHQSRVIEKKWGVIAERVTDSFCPQVSNFGHKHSKENCAPCDYAGIFKALLPLSCNHHLFSVRCPGTISRCIQILLNCFGRLAPS